MKRIFFNMAILACMLTACEKNVIENEEEPIEHPVAVDLGLSVKWASCNIGASAPEDWGDYFSWAESDAKEFYYVDNYKWGVDNRSTERPSGMTRYTGDASKGGDGLSVIRAKDDPARSNWGSKWRTPTKEEMEELLDQTKCQWSFDFKRNGYVVTGISTGKSIFLPCAELRDDTSSLHYTSGNYWTSTLCDDYVASAYRLSMNSGRYDRTDRYIHIEIRYVGLSVRAVTEE